MKKDIKNVNKFLILTCRPPLQSLDLDDAMPRSNADW